jgi:hypothetical protein
VVPPATPQPASAARCLKRRRSPLTCPVPEGFVGCIEEQLSSEGFERPAFRDQIGRGGGRVFLACRREVAGSNLAGTTPRKVVVTLALGCVCPHTTADCGSCCKQGGAKHLQPHEPDVGGVARGFLLRRVERGGGGRGAGALGVRFAATLWGRLPKEATATAGRWGWAAQSVNCRLLAPGGGVASARAVGAGRTGGAGHQGGGLAGTSSTMWPPSVAEGKLSIGAAAVRWLACVREGAPMVRSPPRQAARPTEYRTKSTCCLRCSEKPRV